MRVLFGILTLIYTYLWQQVRALEIYPPTALLPEIEKDSPANMIAHIISYGIGLAAILAVIAITWAGITIIIGSGDDEQMKKWRKIIIFALVGVLLAGIAYLVVNMLANLSFDSPSS